jgi:hypothetical protein
MNTPTFKQQFDKITIAYFENRLNPMDACACFIGNLLNGKEDWIDCRLGMSGSPEKFRLDLTEKNALRTIEIESDGLYSPMDIIEMEWNFLYIWKDGLKTEESLFDAMDSTLDMLKKIHESKGEVIGAIELKKRELATV